MLQKWHVPISGFMQDVERESGTEKLWRKLRQSSAVGPESSLVHPQEWNANWRSLAEFIWRNSQTWQKDENGDNGCRVYIYAYSWGCGHGMVRLSQELQKRGIIVGHAVLCDPVYHHFWRPWRGLFHASWNPPIRVPANVQVVDWYYQRQDRPQGADLMACAATTQINQGIELNRGHAWMDDAAEYHGRVMQVVNSLAIGTHDEQCGGSDGGTGSTA